MSDRTRVVLFEEEGLWVAQCLEHDFAVQGRDLGQLEQRLRRVTAAFRWMARRLGADPFQRFPAAAAAWSARFEATAQRRSAWWVAPADDAAAHEFSTAIWSPGERERREGLGPRGTITADAFTDEVLASNDVETIVYAAIGPVLERVTGRDIVRVPFAYPGDEVLTASVARSISSALGLLPTRVESVPSEVSFLVA